MHSNPPICCLSHLVQAISNPKSISDKVMSQPLRTWKTKFCRRGTRQKAKGWSYVLIGEMGKSGKSSSLKRIHSVFEMSSSWSERSIYSSEIIYFLNNTLFLFALHHEIYEVKGQSGKRKEPLSEQLGVTQWGGPTPPSAGSRPGLTHLPFSHKLLHCQPKLFPRSACFSKFKTTIQNR